MTHATIRESKIHIATQQTLQHIKSLGYRISVKKRSFIDQAMTVFDDNVDPWQGPQSADKQQLLIYKIFKTKAVNWFDQHAWKVTAQLVTLHVNYVFESSDSTHPDTSLFKYFCVYFINELKQLTIKFRRHKETPLIPYRATATSAVLHGIFNKVSNNKVKVQKIRKKNAEKDINYLIQLLHVSGIDAHDWKKSKIIAAIHNKDWSAYLDTLKATLDLHSQNISLINSDSTTIIKSRKRRRNTNSWNKTTTTNKLDSESYISSSESDSDSNLSTKPPKKKSKRLRRRKIKEVNKCKNGYSGVRINIKPMCANGNDAKIKNKSINVMDYGCTNSDDNSEEQSIQSESSDNYSDKKQIDVSSLDENSKITQQKTLISNQNGNNSNNSVINKVQIPYMNQTANMNVNYWNNKGTNVMSNDAINNNVINNNVSEETTSTATTNDSNSVFGVLPKFDIKNNANVNQTSNMDVNYWNNKGGNAIINNVINHTISAKKTNDSSNLFPENNYNANVNQHSNESGNNYLYSSLHALVQDTTKTKQQFININQVIQILRTYETTTQFNSFAARPQSSSMIFNNNTSPNQSQYNTPIITNARIPNVTQNHNNVSNIPSYHMHVQNTKSYVHTMCNNDPQDDEQIYKSIENTCENSSQIFSNNPFYDNSSVGFGGVYGCQTPFANQ
eukprot:336036_1